MQDDSKVMRASAGLANELARSFHQEFPDLAAKCNGRIEKAADLLTSGMVSRTNCPNIFIVRSQSEPSQYYTVTGGVSHCNCLDARVFKYCKHMIAVYLALGAEEFDRELIAWEQTHASEAYQ